MTATREQHATAVQVNAAMRGDGRRQKEEAARMRKRGRGEGPQRGQLPSVDKCGCRESVRRTAGLSLCRSSLRPSPRRPHRSILSLALVCSRWRCLWICQSCELVCMTASQCCRGRGSGLLQHLMQRSQPQSLNLTIPPHRRRLLRSVFDHRSRQPASQQASHPHSSPRLPSLSTVPQLLPPLPRQPLLRLWLPPLQPPCLPLRQGKARGSMKQHR